MTGWPTLALAHPRTFLHIYSCRYRDGGSILTDRVKGVCGGFVESAHEVPVGVERGGDRGVSEAVLEHLGVYAVCDEHGGVRSEVPQ